MQRILTFLLLALFTACSVDNIPQEVRTQAAKSDAVLLCELDTTGSSVRFKCKQTLKTNGAKTPFTAGQFLPFFGGPIEPGVRYGDEAILFLSTSFGSSRVSAHYILFLREGKHPLGLTREDLIRLIQEPEKK